jgi:hypothetical protein
MIEGKYKIKGYYGQWRVTQTQLIHGHLVDVFLGLFDTHREATGFVTLELQGDEYPYHTEHYLYNREVCS